MLTILLIILLLLSNSLTLRRDKSVLLSRLTVGILICSALITYDSLDFMFLNQGIGIFGGLFHTTCITNVFGFFIISISSVILLLTSFYPRKVWLKEYSSLYKFCTKLTYYKYIIVNAMFAWYSIILNNYPKLIYTIVAIFIIIFVIPYSLEFDMIYFNIIILSIGYLFIIYINECNMCLLSEHYTIFIFIWFSIEELGKASILGSNTFMVYMIFLGITRILISLYLNIEMNYSQNTLTITWNKLKFLWKNKYMVIVFFIILLILNGIINYLGLLSLDVHTTYLVSFFCIVFCKLNIIGSIILVIKIYIDKGIDLNTFSLSLESIIFALVLSSVISFLFIPNVLLPFYNNIVTYYNNIGTINFINFSSLWKGFLKINKCLPILGKIMEILENLKYNLMANRPSSVKLSQFLPSINFIHPRIIDLLEAKKLENILPFYHKFPHIFIDYKPMNELTKQFYSNDNLINFLLKNKDELSNVLNFITKKMFYFKEYCNINCYIKVDFKDYYVDFSIKDNLVNMDFTKISSNSKAEININNRYIDKIYNDMGLTNTNKDLIVFMNNNNGINPQFDSENNYSESNLEPVNPILESNTRYIPYLDDNISESWFAQFVASLPNEDNSSNLNYSGGLENNSSNLNYSGGLEDNSGNLDYSENLDNLGNLDYSGSLEDNSGGLDSLGSLNYSNNLVSGLNQDYSSDLVSGLNQDYSNNLAFGFNSHNSNDLVFGLNQDNSVLSQFNIQPYNLSNQYDESNTDSAYTNSVGFNQNNLISSQFNIQPYHLPDQHDVSNTVSGYTNSIVFSNDIGIMNQTTTNSHEDNRDDLNQYIINSHEDNRDDLNQIIINPHEDNRDDLNQSSLSVISYKGDYLTEEEKRILDSNIITYQDMNGNCLDGSKLLIKLWNLKNNLSDYRFALLNVKNLTYEDIIIKNNFEDFVKQLYEKHAIVIKQQKFDFVRVASIWRKLENPIPDYIFDNRINRQDIRNGNFDSSIIIEKLQAVVNGMKNKGKLINKMSITELAYENEKVKHLFFKYARNIMNEKTNSVIKVNKFLSELHFFTGL